MLYVTVSDSCKGNKHHEATFHMNRSKMAWNVEYFNCLYSRI